MSKSLDLKMIIATAAAENNITSDQPLVIKCDQFDDSIKTLTTDFATRLRDQGFVLTLHRDAPLTPNHIEIDGIKDEAGVLLNRPNKDKLLNEPELPLPVDIIKYVQVRVAATCLGSPEKSGFDLFKELDEIDQLGFGHPTEGLIRPDNMVMATCSDGKWTPSMAVPYTKLSFSPNMQTLHYGSADFEGMTAQWADDGTCNIFGMDLHFKRINKGNIRLGLNPLPENLFKEAVIKAVQQNARLIPRKGRMYIRPHCADIGPQMRVGSSGTTGLFVEVTPIGSVGAYFGAQESIKNGSNVPMKVMGVPDNKVRAGKGQGNVKEIGGYGRTAPVIKAVRGLKIDSDGVEKGIYPDGVLYLDSFTDSNESSNPRICETNASNTIFIQNLNYGKYRLVVPSLKHGDILPGNTRSLVITQALELGWEVEERDVYLKEIEDGAFSSAVNCGTAAMLSTFDAIHKVHINENQKKVLAELRGSLIPIRSQEEVNANPTPEPARILLKKLIDIKCGRSGDKDREKYLTQVPGLKIKAT